MANTATRSLDQAELPSPAKDQRRTTGVPENPAAPHAGRTGGAGARAERPADGGKRKHAPLPQTPGRGGKAPSAAN